MKRMTLLALIVATCNGYGFSASSSYAFQSTAKFTEPQAGNATPLAVKQDNDSDTQKIQVEDVKQLLAALAKAKGHPGPLEIILTDGEYKTEDTLLLVAATNVHISAAKNAIIQCTGLNTKTMVIAYCDQVQLENITLKYSPTKTGDGDLANLISIDHSTNVRLTNCTLEIGEMTDNDSTAMAGNSNMDPSKAVKEFLGDEILAIVTNPDKILSFQLNPQDDQGPEMLGPNEITGTGPALSPQQSKILIDVILDEKTYDFTSAKRSFLVPTFGFKFIKGDKEVALLVDAQYRNEVMFVFNGKEKKEDCDRAKLVLQKLTKELFPDAK